MLVELKKMAERPANASRSYNPPVEIHHSIEMTPEEFAFKYATALLGNPRLNSEEGGYYIGDMAVFAVIFDQDPTIFRGEGNCSGASFSHTPSCVNMQKIGEKLVQITIGPVDRDEHYFFRVTDSGLKHLPYGTGCGVRTSAKSQMAYTPDISVEYRDGAWPWIALFPEKFAGVIELESLLNPDDENPLTGLITCKDAPIRTLAKQIAARLTRSRDNWVYDIVESL